MPELNQPDLPPNQQDTLPKSIISRIKDTACVKLEQVKHVLPRHLLRNTILALICFILIWPLLHSFILAPRIATYRYKNPELTNFMKYRMQQAARAGNPFTAHYTFIPLKEISPYLLQSVLYAEDTRFYQHHGVDTEALLTSLGENLKRGHIVWGGSTLTMQLCKNMFLYPKKTYLRKYTEILLALRMEKALPKYRIFELYLNLIEWGPGIFGAEDAAQYYFQKSAAHLDEVESSFLAAIIMNPRLYHKDRENKFYNARQQWILHYLLTGETQEPSDNIELLPEEILEPDVVTPDVLSPIIATTNKTSITTSGTVLTANVTENALEDITSNNSNEDTTF